MTTKVHKKSESIVTQNMQKKNATKGRQNGKGDLIKKYTVSPGKAVPKTG
jgi:hypothetical protein